jgi:hypothetical protein
MQRLTEHQWACNGGGISSRFDAVLGSAREDHRSALPPRRESSQCANVLCVGGMEGARELSDKTPDAAAPDTADWRL